MPGVHLAVLELAVAEGLPLALGKAVPWLSGRGHLNTAVVGTRPEILAALASVHAALGGDADALAEKRPANPPVPDLVHTGSGCAPVA